MNRPSRNFFEFLDAPLDGRTRLVLVLLVVPLLLSFAFPLWRIGMVAPQYPQGLHLDIWSWRLTAGNQGHDLEEINILNHYIGMAKITRDELRDLDWMPFALGGMVLLALRSALLGNIRGLVDLAVLVGYVSVVAFGRFLWMLWTFGHELDPKAPLQVEPFMPVVIGDKQIANFVTHSTPLVGTVLVAAFAGGLWAVTVWALWNGRRRSRAAKAEAQQGVEPLGGVGVQS